MKADHTVTISLEGDDIRALVGALRALPDPWKPAQLYYSAQPQDVERQMLVQARGRALVARLLVELTY